MNETDIIELVHAEVERSLDEDAEKARAALTGVAIGVLILVGSYYGAKRVTKKLVNRHLRKKTEKEAKS
jgi:hypothetical protein